MWGANSLYKTSLGKSLPRHLDRNDRTALNMIITFEQMQDFICHGDDYAWLEEFAYQPFSLQGTL